MRSQACRLFGVLVGVGLLGCNTPPKPTAKVEFSNRTESPEPATRPSASSAPDDNGVSSAALLAQKLKAYQQELEPHLKDRATRQKPTAPAEAPSQVAWTTDKPAAKAGPDNTSLSDVQPPAAKPVVDVTAAAPNQIALATPAPKRSDVPQIVPEGEDFVAPAGPHETPADSDQLLQQLSGKIKDNPRDLAAQLDYQLMQFLRGEQVPQMKAIGGLPSEDREVVTALLDGLSNFRSNVRNDSNQMLSQKIRPLVEMADRLRSQADLTLPNAALCTRVDGYGVYEPITPRFAAGKDHVAIVYCEVENFSSQMGDKKQWETKLSNECILYTETGMVAINDTSKSILDRSRNRRHDFFIVKKVKFPSTLPMGRYVLKISVTDEQSNRVAETTIPVQIGAE